MPFAPFSEYFLEIAEKETRTITVYESSAEIPPGEYLLAELYCDEKKCDCRRVFFYVISARQKGPEAVIAYGWESEKFYAKWLRDSDPAMVKELQGPTLNIGSPQSELALPLLEIVKEILANDVAYVERLKKHYAMFRACIERTDRIQPFRRRKVKKQR